MGYIKVPVPVDATQFLQGAVAFMRTKMPGWDPIVGTLDNWILEAGSTWAADLGTTATGVPDAIMRWLGATMYRIPPQDELPAKAETTWIAKDTLGHFIYAGTQVGIPDASGEVHGFLVDSTIEIPAGQNITEDGEVKITAAIAGGAANNLGAANQVIEMLDHEDWLSSIVLVASTSGGQEAEADSDYLDRLVEEFEIITARPILARDYAPLARKVAGVWRAMAIDNYNPANGTENNERMVAVYALDIAGNEVSGTTGTELAAFLEDMREQNFVVPIGSPSYTTIDITATAKRLSTAIDIDTLKAQIEAALTAYLSPSNWGEDPSVPRSWNNNKYVRYLEISEVINDVIGVDYIVGGTLRIGLHGAAQGVDDITMVGKVTLPRPGTFMITVT